MNKIKAILFDIDDTLFASSKFSERARNKAISAMIKAGLKTNKKRAKNQLNKIIKKYGSNYSFHFDKLVEYFDSKDKNYIIAAGIYAYHREKSKIKPYLDTKKILNLLRKKQYILAVATEGRAIKQWDKLIRLNLDSNFDYVFVTDSKKGIDGVRFFKKICSKLNLEPNQLCMIGDNPQKDIIPAEEAGLHSIRIFNGKHKTVKCKTNLQFSDLSYLLNYF